MLQNLRSLVEYHHDICVSSCLSTSKTLSLNRLTIWLPNHSKLGIQMVGLFKEKGPRGRQATWNTDVMMIFYQWSKIFENKIIENIQMFFWKLNFWHSNPDVCHETIMFGRVTHTLDATVRWMRSFVNVIHIL